MSIPTEFLTELTSDEKNQIDNNFPDIMYIDPKTKNNVLHLIACIYKFKDKSEMDAIIDNLIGNKLVDINNVNSRKRTPLMIACKYSQELFIKKVLEINCTIDFNLKDDVDLSITEWLCVRNYSDMIVEFIQRGCKCSYEELSKISDSSFRGQISEILFGKVIEFKYGDIDEDLPEDSEFRIYGENDFTFNEGEKIGAGTYGFATIATDKTTGKKVVLKKFQYANKSSQPVLLQDQVLRDIIFLREMNKKKHSVQIYGLFTDSKGSLYMILEYLERKVSDQFKLIENLTNKNERIKQYKRLMYEMLICIDGNSRAGIIHCDTKGDNVMIDFKGRVRNIDYGFSYYLGISPNVNNINHRIHEGVYLMQDGRPETIMKESSNETAINVYKEGTNDLLFHLSFGYLGYNLDVGSVGLLFVQTITGYSNNGRFCYHDGKIYKFYPKSNSEIRCSTFYADEKTNVIDRLKDRYGDELTDIICKMISPDYSIRPTAKELIFDTIFDNIPCEYPKDLQLTNLEPKSTDSSWFKEYDTVSKQNYIRTGFVYYDDIIKHWSNLKFRKSNVSVIPRQFIDEFIVFFGKKSLDSIVSSLIYFHSINARIISKESCVFDTNDFINRKMTHLAIGSMKTSIYDDDSFNHKEIFERLRQIKNSSSLFSWYKSIDDIGYTNQMKEINMKVKLDSEFFRLTPIMVFIGYIKFILQVVCNDEAKIKLLIEKLIQDTYDFILDGLTNSTGSRVVSIQEYNMFDLIKHLYYLNSEAIDINLRPTGTYV